MKTLRNYVVMLIVVGLAFAAAVCWGAEAAPSAKVLLNKTVAVSGNGGSAAVSFSATKGQRVKISLKASAASMEPYSFFEGPGAGNGEYLPPVESAKGGKNETELTITKGGKYSLTIFDGSNAGGSVHVIITAL